MLILSIHAQTLSIEDCYKLAEQNYPLIKQRDLILKSRDYTTENAAKSYLPQLSINGQATYQSEVTQVPIKLPGSDISAISKDQYKIYAELNQTLYDAGTTEIQKQTAVNNANLESAKLEVEIYKIKERINQLFFGTLICNEQLTQSEIMIKDIELGIAKADAAIANGASLKSSVDVLQAEHLKVKQHLIELRFSRIAYLDMLGLFLNQTLNENTVLQTPEMVDQIPDNKRPELIVFDQQQKGLDTQTRLINARNRPRLSMFVQAGYGRPALNFLNNDLKSYYIGGVRFSWALSGFYSRKSEKLLVDINRSSIDVQKETFLYNTNLTLKQQNADVAKLQELIRTDHEIMLLRTKIKKTALAQLESGVINSNDYMREVHAEDLAKQNQTLHEMQLRMTQYSQLITLGY